MAAVATAAGVDHRHRSSRIGDRQVLLGGRTEQVEPEQQVHRTGSGLDGGVDRSGGEADVGDHRAALLGQAGLVEPGGVATVEVGGHLQDARDGDHPGPPDARHADQQVIRAYGGGVGHPGRPAARPAGAARGGSPPGDRLGVTSTNDGQSPSRQDRSWLHDPWWIAVLRPNSVSTGTTERQLDFSPQSPQPSHTLGLIQTRSVGSGSRAAPAQPPFLGRAAVVVDRAR